MNTELLLQVKKHILEDPLRLSMGEWISRYNDGCGTTGCIAGWTCILAGHNSIHMSKVKEQAIILLDIDENQADKLFFIKNWPKDLKIKYLFGKSKAQTAEIAAELIDRFIANA